MSSSGISWAICKSAPHSRQITTPAPYHSGTRNHNNKQKDTITGSTMPRCATMMVTVGTSSTYSWMREPLSYWSPTFSNCAFNKSAENIHMLLLYSVLRHMLHVFIIVKTYLWITNSKVKSTYKSVHVFNTQSATSSCDVSLGLRSQNSSLSLGLERSSVGLVGQVLGDLGYIWPVSNFMVDAAKTTVH